MSETDGRPSIGPGAFLAAGRNLAEQHVRDSGVSFRLASFAYPQLAGRAMRAAMAEEQYFAKCHALGGISMDDARQILDDATARVDRQGSPAEEAYSRAWEEVIERPARMGASPWQELLTSRGIPRKKLEEIKAGLLRMAGDAPDSDEPDEQPDA